MKIYTSYFGNLKNIEQNNIVPIAICQVVPKFYSGRVISLLAPPKEILWKIKSGECGELEYTEVYEKEVLNRYTPEMIMSHINHISENYENGRDIALICYERPEKFCHRHILSSWLRDAGFDVSEYENYKK